MDSCFCRMWRIGNMCVRKSEKSCVSDGFCRLVLASCVWIGVHCRREELTIDGDVVIKIRTIVRSSMLCLKRFVILAFIVVAMGRGQFVGKHGRNPKKRRHGRKPPARSKEDVSVGSLSDIIVEDASVDCFSDADSCFSACLASKKPYNGPVDCSLAGEDYNCGNECPVPVVDCSFLQREKSHVDGHGDDGMECDNVEGVSAYNGEDLVDTESEKEASPSAQFEEIFGVGLDDFVDLSWPDSDSDTTSVEEDVGDDDSSISNNHLGFTFSNDCCNNCRRKCMASGSVDYQVQLRVCRITKGRFKRRFSNYSWAEIVLAAQADGSSRVSRDAVRLKLCQHCRAYLISERSQNKADKVWPAMVWKWLSAEAAILEHGSKLWSLIPRLWRLWWLDSVQQLHVEYRSVTLDDPPCAFDDVTARKDEFQMAVDMKRGGLLAATCRKDMYSTVWCPWGEMEYLHRCGSLPLDLIVTRLFGDCIQTIKGNVRDDLRKVVGIIENYLDGECGRILGNPKWEVRPSIAFENGAPMVLTCRRHQSGCKGRYLHLPQNPGGTLSSFPSDQLTPAVVRPRTVQQLKIHEFSDSYQMREMQGQYNGVDTIRVCEHHNFASQSKVLRDREETSLLGRSDLRALVGEWGQDGTLPPEVAESRIADAKQYGASTERVEKCCEGATFMTLEDSLRVQKMNKDGERHVVRTKVDGEWKEHHYVPSWPGCLVNVHPFDRYGASFPILPKMYDGGMSDTRLAFYLTAMHGALPALWESSNNCIQTVASWEGWLLSYLARKCFPSCQVRGKNNPFKFKSPDSQLSALCELLVRVGLRENPQSTVSEEDGRVMENESMAENGSIASVQSFLGWNRARDNDGDSALGWNGSDIADDVENGESESDDDSSMGWMSEDTGNPLHTDGLFHVDDLELLFAEHTDVIVGSSTGVPQILNNVEKEIASIIVYHDEEAMPHPRSGSRLATELCCHHGDAWELRFVGGCGASNSEDRFVLARHGGVFPGWWKQEYTNSKSYDWHQERLDDNQIASECRRWDVAIYVRKQSVPLEECRDLILHCMGSQTNVFCREHDVPLITAPFSTDCLCCLATSDGPACSKSITLRCPVDGCASAVCKVHGEQAGSNNCRLYIEPQQPSNGVVANNDATGISDQESDSDTDSDWMPTEEELLMLLSSDTDDSLGNEDESVSSESQLDGQLCSDMRDNLVLDVVCDENVPLNGDNPDMQPYGGIDVPVCCDEEEPLSVRGDPSSISGCCILNNMGSLLVRRGSKLRGSMNQRFFLQRIVATTPGRAVPLVYPEAMLFPSLFWKDAGDDGAILGAMPCGLLAHDATLQKYGIASMQSHLYARLTNPTLGTSTDPRYVCHAFDSMVNLGCRHEDVRVILHRGVTGTNDGVRVADSGPGNVTDKSFFDTDSVDSRPTVNKLAAAVADKQATYFYTQTANALDHFGLSEIKRWIESDEVMDIFCSGTETTAERGEIRECLRQAASLPLLRNWIEVSILYMDYIANSDERPLGHVEHIWWRFEFQDSVGNLPHIHALIWLADGESPQITNDRIRGSIMELIRPEEIDDLVAEGLLSCAEEVMSVKDLASRVLVHICSSRCQRRVGIKDDEVVCRATDNETESPDPKTHCVRAIRVDHSEAAVKVLVKVGLFVLDDATQIFEPVVDELVATKHYPPAHNSEGIISACNGFLFVLTRSNGNLKRATGYLASRYLAKYLALVDENNRVYIGSMSQERKVVHLEQVVLHNTKITGSAIQEAKRDSARHDRKNPTGRAISHMEMLCVVLGYDQVYTNLQFIHIPTVPLEERPAFDRTRPFTRLKEEGVVSEDAAEDRPQDLDAADVIAAYKVRNLESDDQLPLWRQVGALESLLLRDQCLSPQTVDAITLFGIRPPELRFVRQPRLYFRWFYRDVQHRAGCFKEALDVQREAANPNLAESCWVDGSNCRVYMRPFAAREILEYLYHGDRQTGGRRWHESFYSCDMEDDGLIPAVGTSRQTVTGVVAPLENPWNETMKLFRTLNGKLENPPRVSNSPFSQAAEQWKLMKARFVGLAGFGKISKPPIIWYNSVKPTQAGRWLIHILLSMGEFDCETNLLGHGNMVDNFVRARLLREDISTREQDVTNLIGRYIVEQLVFLPGGAKQFDRHVVAADRVLRQCLLHGELAVDEIPASLYTHIMVEQDKKIRASLLSIRKFLATIILRDLGNAKMMALPASADDVVNASVMSPLNWKPELIRTAKQSAESFKEQKVAMDLAIEQLNKFQYETTSQTSSLIIIGGPGTGKTTCLQAIGLMAMARGLNTGLSTMMSERAKQLGGKHLSKWFCIPVNERATPTRLAELAIARLVRNPQQLALIRSLDVLLLDEFGQISAEMLAVLDIILRRIRDSTDFMGGVLLFATLDECQLRPVSGRPPLLSPHILTSFKFCGLDYSVRAAHDKHLRRIIEITRMPKRQRTAAIRREFKFLIATKCTFVDNWDDPLLKMDILRMFAKHKAREDAECRLLTKMKAQYRDDILCARAADFESSTESNWVDATSATSRLLSQKVKEPKRLYFYPRATYEITFNREGQFSQSQLAVLAEMPTAVDVRELHAVSVYVAPDGMKAIPAALRTESDFLDAGFHKRQIGTAPERSKYIGLGILAKRRQFGLRHRLAATIHAGMGQDLPALITCVTGNSMYDLFQREQVVVLLSRTHYAKDIIFVGDPEATAEALATMLDTDGPYSEYMEYLVRRLLHSFPERAPSIDQTLRHPYCAANVDVPNNSSGFCYLLASTARGVEGRVTYIGQTCNLVARFKNHKLGAGPSATADPGLKPWAMLAYVSGFEGAGQAQRMYFERLWQVARDRKNRRRRGQNMSPLTADEIADLGKNLVGRRVYRCCPGLEGKTLAFVRCGRFLAR